MKEKYSAVNMKILQEKGYFGHDDASLIIDGDPHFIINPISREIVNNSKKTDLIQFDHNSERITFECPHFIEGHDMTFCNKVVIDYSVGESKGVYEVNDLAVKEDDSDTVVFTWLISSNVTTTLGKIKFALTFKCVLPDGSVTYKWGTKRNDTLQCLETEQGNAWVAYDYPDILEQWKTIIFDAKDNSVKDIVSSTNNGVAKIVAEGKIQTQAINTTGITVKNDIEKKAADTLATIPEDYTHLDSDVAALKSENVRYSARFGNALIKKATGNKSVSILDSADAVFHDLQISGKSEQLATTGAQLQPFGYDTITHVGVTLTIKNDLVSLLGTATYSGGRNTLKLSDVTLQAGSYTISMSDAINAVMAVTDDANSVLVQGANIKELKFNIVKETSIHIGFNVISGNVYNITGLRIMLNAGDTAHPWEPYTGGAPSPSPEYPQDIISVGTVSTGAQMLDFEQCLKEWNSKYTQSNGRVYTVNALGTGFQNPISFSDEDIKVTLSGKVRDISGSAYRIDLLDSSGNLVGRIIKDTKSITGMASKIRLNFAEGGVGEYADIMLNAGDTALPWELYTGGKPSPSVEYPQVVEVEVTGAQLLNPALYSKGVYNGVTFSSDLQGRVILNGSATVVTQFFLGDYINELTDGETYCLSNVSNSNFAITENGSPKYSKVVSVNKSTMTQIKVYIQIDSGTVCTNKIYAPMLNAGDTALPWEPYKSYQTAAITLTEPLRGIGEYRDRIMYRDGAWGIERWITKLTLAGNEDWVIYGDSSYISFYTRNSCLPVSMNKREGLCEQLRVMTIGGKNLNSIWLGTNNKVVYAIDNQFYDDTLEDKGLANWKAHLAESPLEIITYLDAPTWTPLPTATQQALNELTTYAGTTHLTITAGGPPAGIAAEYVQDINVVIAELLSQIEELRNAHTN